MSVARVLTIVHRSAGRAGEPGVDPSAPTGVDLARTAIRELADGIAARRMRERFALDHVTEFTSRVFAALEALVDELTAQGLPVAIRRTDNVRCEIELDGLPERIVLLRQQDVGYIGEQRGALGALSAYVTDRRGLGFPVERFLVSESGEIHCEGICVPPEEMTPDAMVRRLIATIWAETRRSWAPFESLSAVPVADLEALHSHAQLGFRAQPVRRR